jgi:hypothetical protein
MERALRSALSVSSPSSGPCPVAAVSGSRRPVLSAQRRTAASGLSRNHHTCRAHAADLAAPDSQAPPTHPLRRERHRPALGLSNTAARRLARQSSARQSWRYRPRAKAAVPSASKEQRRQAARGPRPAERRRAPGCPTAGQAQRSAGAFRRCSCVCRRHVRRWRRRQHACGRSATALSDVGHSRAAAGTPGVGVGHVGHEPVGRRGPCAAGTLRESVLCHRVAKRLPDRGAVATRRLPGQRRVRQCLSRLELDHGRDSGRQADPAGQHSCE